MVPTPFVLINQISNLDTVRQKVPVLTFAEEIKWKPKVQSWCLLLWSFSLSRHCPPFPLHSHPCPYCIHLKFSVVSKFPVWLEEVTMEVVFHFFYQGLFIPEITVVTLLTIVLLTASNSSLLSFKWYSFNWEMASILSPEFKSISIINSLLSRFNSSLSMKLCTTFVV